MIKTRVALRAAVMASICSMALSQTALSQTATTIRSSNSSGISVGEPLTLTATVTGSTGSGTVAFYDRAEFLGVAGFQSGQPATYKTSQLLPGDHKLAALYMNASGSKRSVSAVINQQVWSSPTTGFVLGQAFPSGVGPQFAVGDYNNDGRADIATIEGCNILVYLTNCTIVVYFGQAGGTFSAPVQQHLNLGEGIIALQVFGMASTYPSGTTNAGLLIAIEEVQPSYSYQTFTSVSVQSGNGDGTFSQIAGAGNAPYTSIQVNDFNHDGVPDINFTLPDPYIDDLQYLTPVTSVYASADFNRDGNPDILLVQGNPIFAPVVILLGTGNFTYPNPAFQAPIYPYESSTPVGVPAVGDFNRDGIPDLALPISGGVLILLGHGDGTFAAPVEYPIPSAGGAIPVLTAGDINGDGKPDLLTNGAVLYGNGDGTLQPAKSVLNAAPGFLADFNGDGRLDVLTVTASGTLQILLGSN